MSDYIQNAQNILDDRLYKIKPIIIAKISIPPEYRNDFADVIQQCFRQMFLASLMATDLKSKKLKHEQLDYLVIRIASSFSAPHFGRLLQPEPPKFVICLMLEWANKDGTSW